MKKLGALLLSLTFAFVSTGRSAVLLDDDWDDGDRTDTNLPEESAWYANNAAGSPTLSAEPGTLIGNVLMFGTNTSSRQWMTHFTPTGTPVELGLGDTLRITLTFMASNVTTSPTTTRGLRIGLFNFSEPGAARVTGDGFSTGTGTGAPGANVTGYMLNMNFAQTTTINNPLQIMKRTDLPNVNLMGATAVYTALSSGGGPMGNPAFSNNVPYTMEILAKRLATGTQITTTFTDTNGWILTHSVTDSTSPTFKFDGLALRPNGVVDTAETFTFTRLMVETVPYALRINSIQFVDPSTTRITWDALPDKTYDIYVRPNFGPASTWSRLGSSTTGTFDDGDAGFEIERYYQVVQLP